MQRSALPAVALSLVALAACASRQASPLPEPAVMAAGALGARPVLLGCSAYTAAPVYEEEVHLSFTVDERGQVLPASVRVEPSQPFADGLRKGPAQPSARAVAAAKRAALSCSYEAARAGDRPVRARVVERFTF